MNTTAVVFIGIVIIIELNAAIMYATIIKLQDAISSSNIYKKLICDNYQMCNKIEAEIRTLSRKIDDIKSNTEEVCYSMAEKHEIIAGYPVVYNSKEQKWKIYSPFGEFLGTADDGKLLDKLKTIKGENIND